MPVAKEQIRQIISENNLNSVTDVYTLLRNSFKDIHQELMEASSALSEAIILNAESCLFRTIALLKSLDDYVTIISKNNL